MSLSEILTKVKGLKRCGEFFSRYSNIAHPNKIEINCWMIEKLSPETKSQLFSKFVIPSCFKVNQIRTRFPGKSRESQTHEKLVFISYFRFVPSSKNPPIARLCTSWIGAPCIHPAAYSRCSDNLEHLPASVEHTKVGSVYKSVRIHRVPCFTIKRKYREEGYEGG